ncbi:phage tail domain-containing protein [Marinilactibacillus psychrotolerans]|uniref:phage tail domain-containing protein n=1 Tax=Marinilactibacillus psychrotolerans TaxID=191770 RepID=UPI003887DFB7
MLTIDDEYRLEDFGMYVSSGFADPNTPQFSDTTLKVPKKPGRTLIRQVTDIREIELPIQFAHYRNTDTQGKLDKLSDLFYDDEGNRKRVKISLDHWQGKYVYGYLANPISSDRSDIIQSLNLSFICYDPYKYSPVYSDEILWGSEELTFESQYILGHEGSDGLVSVTDNTSINVYVDGLVVYPTIELQGTANRLTITNSGQSIVFPDFNDSNWIVERFNSWQDDQERFISAYKFKLNKGKNTIQISGSDMNLQIRIKYKDLYK